MSLRRGCARPARRAAFTLIELLLVLAVLVAVAGMSWPALRGPAAAARLRDAARKVGASLSECRLAAIEQGVAMQWRYAVDADRCGYATMAHEEAISTREANRIEATSSRRDRQAGEVYWLTLPDGVRFVVATPLMHNRGSASDEYAAPSGRLFDAFAQHTDMQWAPAVLFFPDGRSTGASITLAESAGDTVTIALDGVSGRVSIGPLQRGDDADFVEPAP